MCTKCVIKKKHYMGNNDSSTAPITPQNNAKSESVLARFHIGLIDATAFLVANVFVSLYSNI